MAATPGLTEVVLYDALVNYLISMARLVEGAMNRALDALEIHVSRFPAFRQIRPQTLFSRLCTSAAGDAYMYDVGPQIHVHEVAL